MAGVQGYEIQAYPHLLCGNGTLYWAKASVFREIRSFYSNRLKGYEISRNRVVDIDTIEDYEIPEMSTPKLLEHEGGN